MKVNQGNKSWTGTIGKTDDTNDGFKLGKVLTACPALKK